ncbi:ABC transporter permease [Pseudoflavonifractor sp. MSJ-30]|uniref:ABC transporter permease n=1 Tax=Pseudoflavonifractor sp. MSJ-30 TaxID=2841525 RepID=UPI001C0F8096|nr:ABC transporter permease [Pseudoflavonifractor sp. MSJ-30]MBU5452831.1 ABC transporter permease [Pseudoflavonifractor sp. MSJ-30]
MHEDLSQYTDEELFAPVSHSDAESEKIAAPRYSYWKSVFRVFFRKKVNIIALCLLLFVILFAYIYPAVTSYDAYANLLDPNAKHLGPAQALNYFGHELKWILGSGASGESTFDAVWNGSRISISLAFICAAINMTVGVMLGAVWGFSKKVDMVMMEVYTIIGNVPMILIISVLSMLFSPTFWTMVFALTIVGWLSIAYFIRTQVLIIRDREYNLASRCLGTSIFKIATKNILPFMTSVIVTLLATELPSYISYEVFLSYIGMGMSEMSLGRLIYAAEAAMVTPGWQMEFWSPVAIASIITVVLYVVGQNLGDASDPRTHM